MKKDEIIIVCLSGRGDKDVAAMARYRGVKSMIKIEEAFKNKKAFIPFVLAGYPNLETTENLF